MSVLAAKAASTAVLASSTVTLSPVIKPCGCVVVTVTACNPDDTLTDNVASLMNGATYTSPIADAKALVLAVNEYSVSDITEMVRRPDKSDVPPLNAAVIVLDGLLTVTS